ncbi:MAG: uncharacterized protein KVP18_001854, partial [Porospora cf. gigantea A]|uniref:uncharacterized protein n=2 Tax=Porospora cf. gigantea A TaxID=2853593 RepID=UPI003559C981
MLEADLDNGSALLTSDDDEQFSWIEWFCKLKGNEFFGQVDEDYIRDEFNLTGLSAQVPCYDRAMDMILDNEEDDDSSSEDARVLEKAALKLYGLIHARFVLTKRGITVMHPKYQESVFGTCANVYCQNQSVLPIGVTDTPGVHNTKVFCPRCNEIYNPRSKRLAQ